MLLILVNFTLMVFVIQIVDVFISVHDLCDCTHILKRVPGRNTEPVSVTRTNKVWESLDYNIFWFIFLFASDCLNMLS